MQTGITTNWPTQVIDSGFRLYLQAELARRCTANAQYSLRSFALQLDIHHSTLSQLLRGKRALTERTIEKLGTRLGLTPSEIAAFVASERRPATDTARAIRQLTLDTAALLADPTHRALLELTRLEQFVADSRWLARVLNLSVDEINVAVQRLLRLGLLAMPERGRWLDCSGAAARTQDEFAQFIISNLSAKVRQLSLPATSAKGEAARDEATLPATVFTLTPTQLLLVKEFIAGLQPTAPNAEEADEAETYQLEIQLTSLHHA